MQVWVGACIVAVKGKSSLSVPMLCHHTAFYTGVYVVCSTIALTVCTQKVHNHVLRLQISSPILLEVNTYISLGCDVIDLLATRSGSRQDQLNFICTKLRGP